MKRTTINKEEIDKFSKIADEWWSPDGKFKPLVSHTYKIEDSVSALKFIQDRKATGKVIVEM